MNTVKQTVVLVGDGRHEHMVTALIDGQEVTTAHRYHTEANQRVAWLIKNCGCVEQTA